MHRAEPTREPVDATMFRLADLGLDLLRRKATLVQLRLQADDRPPARRAAYDQAIAQYEALAKDRATKEEELRVQAGKDQELYDALNFQDDQFDLSDALLAIAILLLALTSLTRLWWLFGVLMGLAGLLGWALHPSLLIKMLS